MFVYIIYGRLKSTRLPEEALVKINNKSLINIFIERISLSNKIVFTTSDLEEEKSLAKVALNDGLEAFCGYPEDVLLRIYETAKQFGYDYFFDDHG